MPLPEGFSEFEHLQDTLRRVHNQLVREEFSDLENSLDDPDIKISRQALYKACRMEDADTGDMSLMRMWLFYCIAGKAASFHPPMYGIPAQDFQESIKFHPQIKLFFQEDWDRVDQENGFYPTRSEIHFRLMGETAESLTPAKARDYATKIRNIFCTGKGFVWKRGKEFWSYIDMHKGYYFKLYTDDKQEAQNIINKVLDVQNHTPDWDKYLKDATKRRDLKATSPMPPTELIYGKRRRLPRNKPVAYVRFKYAELHIHGLPQPITLVDKGGTRRVKALVAV